MSLKSIVTPSGKFAYDRMHFSEAILSNGFLFCSGIVGTNEKGKLPATLTEEFQNLWDQADRLLKQAGARFSDVVECTSYHVDVHNHIREFSRLRDQHLGEPWPAWTAIGVTELLVPGAHVEMRIIARVP